MPRVYKNSKNFDRVLDKLKRKDKTLFESLLGKMDEIFLYTLVLALALKNCLHKPLPA